jgi:BASS family bile acid:Na+ symporter
MRLNDLILFAVIVVSMSAAVFFPHEASIFQPFILCYMMLLLFLSFLRIDFRALTETSVSGTIRLAISAVVKLVVLPAALYAAALILIPDYAIPVLLLSGISTGVVAPFIGSLLEANMAQIVRMVIVTSLLVPFSLPALVKILAGSEIAIPFSAMFQLLGVVIFVPMTAVVLIRRFAPRVSEVLIKFQFPAALILFACVNLGVFSRYSSFFFGHPAQVAMSLGVAYGLSVVYYAAGFLIIPAQDPAQRLAGGVSLAIINNVLVIVFSSNFFDALSPLLAAVYMFPFYTMIVPIRLLTTSSRLSSLRVTGG